MAKQDTPLQTLYKLTIMTGTLAVGSLAAYRYGPPAEDLAAGINRVIAMAEERIGSEPQAFAADHKAQPLETASAPVFDAAVAPVAFAESVAPSAPASPAVPGAVVEPWGNEGMHRASVSMPGRLGSKRYDAIGASPGEALERLATKIRSSRLR